MSKEILHSCELCKYKSIYKSNLKKHKSYIHGIDIIWFNCDQENCNYKCKSKGSLKIHKSNVHDIDVKWHYCNLCDFKCKDTGILKKHKSNKHDINTTWYECTLCDSKFKSTSHLKRHKSFIHDINTTWYECTLCDSKFKSTSHLKRHNSFIHDIDVKWCYCNLCDFKCKKDGILKQHESNKHDMDVKWKHCNLCGFKCKINFVLKQHKSYVHDIDVKWFSCNFPNCDSKFKCKGGVKSHFKSMHTKEGQARQKKEEQKVSRLLTKHDLAFDRENRINYKKDGKSCFESDKSWAQIDFTLYRKDCTILLEVDENQHKYGYGGISCDMKRMSHIYTAIRITGNMLPILFLRYNPHDFKIENIKQKVEEKERQEKLIKFINSYCPSDKEMEIFYLYYDQEENGETCVVKSKEYKLGCCVVK